MSHFSAARRPAWPFPSTPAAAFRLISAPRCRSMHTQSFSLPTHLTRPPLSPPRSDWSTPARERVLPSWILTSLSACVLAPSKAWRPMCSGWTLPRICPHGLICWWRAATAPPSSSKRSQQVRIESQKIAIFCNAFHHLQSWPLLNKGSKKKGQRKTAVQTRKFRKN